MVDLESFEFEIQIDPPRYGKLLPCYGKALPPYGKLLPLYGRLLP